MLFLADTNLIDQAYHVSLSSPQSQSESTSPVPYGRGLNQSLFALLPMKEGMWLAIQHAERDVMGLAIQHYLAVSVCHSPLATRSRCDLALHSTPRVIHLSFSGQRLSESAPKTAVSFPPWEAFPLTISSGQMPPLIFYV